jgi:hypothetical protein
MTGSTLNTDIMNPPTTINPTYTPTYTQPSQTDPDQRLIISPETLGNIYKNGQMTNDDLASFLEASYMTKNDAGIHMAARGYEMDENLSGENVKVFVKYAKDYDQYGSPEPIKVIRDSNGNLRVDPNGEPLILDATLTNKGSQLSGDPVKAFSDLFADIMVAIGANIINPRNIGGMFTADSAEDNYGPINAVGHSLGGTLVSDNPQISGTKYIFNDGAGLDSLIIPNGSNIIQFRVPGDPVSGISTVNPGDNVIKVPNGIDPVTGNNYDNHQKGNFTDYLRGLPENTTPPALKPPPIVVPVE